MCAINGKIIKFKFGNRKRKRNKAGRMQKIRKLPIKSDKFKTI